MKLSVRVARALALAGRAVSQRKAKGEGIERLLDLDLSERDHQSIGQVCELDGVRLGSYYAWYWEKKLLATFIRGGDPDLMRDMLMSSDRTVLARLERVLSAPRGCIVAIPHYGHYVLAIVSMLHHISRARDVAVLYGDPATHKGNEIFDYLYRSLFYGREPRVRILHGDRSGLIAALRLLRGGGVLLMLPDAYADIEDTHVVPFFGRPMNVMLGSAVMARKSESRLIPAIAFPAGVLRFSIEFGDSIPSLQGVDSVSSKAASFELQDYASTALMFQQFERWMMGRTMYWQYLRQHFYKRCCFNRLRPEVVDLMWDQFLKDPRLAAPLAVDFHLN